MTSQKSFLVNAFLTSTNNRYAIIPINIEWYSYYSVYKALGSETPPTPTPHLPTPAKPFRVFENQPYPSMVNPEIYTESDSYTGSR